MNDCVPMVSRQSLPSDLDLYLKIKRNQHFGIWVKPALHCLLSKESPWMDLFVKVSLVIF